MGNFLSSLTLIARIQIDGHLPKNLPKVSFARTYTKIFATFVFFFKSIFFDFSVMGIFFD